MGFGLLAVLLPETPDTGIPWKDISGGGAALLLLVALGLFLKFLRDERKAQEEARQASEAAAQRERELISARTAEIAKTFSETSSNILAQFRDETRSTRQELHQLVRDINHK